MSGKKRESDKLARAGASIDPPGHRVDGALEAAHSESETRIKASMQFSGPLPPPALLAQYDKILPGGADRLFKMFEVESSHRRALLDSEQVHTHVIELRGQIFAFVISVLGLGIATALALTDQGVSAAAVASTIFGTGGLLYWLNSRQRAEGDVTSVTTSNGD